MLLLPLPAGAQQAASLEAAVKATFLSKFIPFVGWPAAPNSGPIGICLVGNDAVTAIADRAVAGQSVGDRQIIVRHLPYSGPFVECQSLYLAAPDTEKSRILNEIQAAPILTITDAATDNSAKGIINFVLRDNRVRFEIDNAAAIRSRLEISSKLLSLAVSVR